MRGLFILDEKHDVIPCPDSVDWGKWFKDYTLNRFVRKTHIQTKEGTVTVVTSFIGIDRHCLCDKEIPNGLYETFVSGGVYTGTRAEADTWNAAEEVHQTVCDHVNNGKEYPFGL